MSRTGTDIGELARSILDHEANGTSGAAGVVTALGQACRKLDAELVSLVGAGGVTALASRALSLAKRDHAVLGSVTVARNSALELAGLDAAFAQLGATEARAAAAAVIQHLLALLVRLLGEDLGLTPVRGIWPGVAISPSAPPRVDPNE